MFGSVTTLLRKKLASWPACWIRPPFWNQNKLTSGMDCLIVVLRRIYSHNMLSESVLEALHWLVEAEENNPILLHTWNVFGRSRGATEKATAARVKVEEAIRLLGLDLVAGFSFDGIAETGLISNNKSIDYAMVIHEWKGEITVFPPSRPWIIRVMLEKSAKTDEAPPFQELRHFQLPIWKQLREGVNLAFDITDEIPYHLLAVARLREKDSSESDYVRTYSGYGANIVPDYEPITFKSKDWTLATPGKFMLSYGLPPDDLGSTDVTNCPEIHKLAREMDLAYSSSLS
ncbi:hypothetical protein FPHYL_13376 [Fusarium phyllophilum]|uniref:Uncharacterized protein n=1 Tax=Fusarium phyllophilum TaxID=47803 RepID=A0A8H5MNY7_9HYPO|nr:hypothetical protein FPHYL_13376 [Fusarium phyllophilum]